MSFDGASGQTAGDHVARYNSLPDELTDSCSQPEKHRLCKSCPALGIRSSVNIHPLPPAKVFLPIVVSSIMLKLRRVKVMLFLLSLHGIRHEKHEQKQKRRLWSSYCMSNACRSWLRHVHHVLFLLKK